MTINTTNAKANRWRNAHRWRYIGRAERNTHKYFVEVATGGVVIADDSGDFPHQTDDGVLYVDFTRSIIPISGSLTGGYLLGLLRPDGRKSHTPISRREKQWLLERWPGEFPNA